VTEWRARDLFGHAALFGVLGGILESLSHFVYRGFFQGKIPLGLYLTWMPAAANALLFLVVALILWPAMRRWPTRLTPKRLTGLFAGLATMAALRKFDGVLSIITVDLIAIGVGVQCAALLGRRQEALRRVVRWAAPAAVGVTVLTAVGVELHYRLEERRALAALPPAPAGVSNVLLLVLDTVRAMNLSVYGYPRRTTPVMERLAAQGTRFERVVATAPWTLPSHASIMTGRWEHQLSANWDQPLDGTYPTLAEVLAARGYRTGGFAANLAYCARNMGLDRGFSHYEGNLVTFTQVLRSASLTRWVTNWPFVSPLLPPMREDYHRKTSRQVSDAMLRWLDRGDPHRPFFAFLNWFDAHHAYLAPPPFDTMFSSPAYPAPPPPQFGGRDPKERPRPLRTYDQAIASQDFEIGRLLQELDRRGVLAHTLVIITADHGEEFGEHGMYGHGHDLYMAGLGVPLILLEPGRVPSGKVVPNPVSLRDLAATIMDLAAHSPPAPLGGASLARFWQAQPLPPDTLLAGTRYAWNHPDWYPTSKGDLHGAFAGVMLFIREATGEQELYDVAADPWQHRDLGKAPEQAAAVRSFRGFVDRNVGPPIPHAESR
jgi:arylsulfatase A-like enzyme